MGENSGWYEQLQAPGDVDKTPPLNGQALVWDSAKQLWVPTDVGSVPGADEKVKVSDADTTTNKLDPKLVVGPGLTKTILNPGGNEQLQIGLYTAISISSFVSNPASADNGQTIDDVTLTWTLAGPTETDQTLDSAATGHEHILPGIYTRVYGLLGLTATNLWTLWVTDGTSTDTAVAGVRFYNRRYWDPLVNPGPLTDPDIQAMTSEYATARQCTKVYDCTGGKYIWMCYPTSWDEGEFWVGGLQVVFLETIQDFTNIYGYTESYRVYRSLYIQNGSEIPVEVK